jgi:hypothetical protein
MVSLLWWLVPANLGTYSYRAHYNFTPISFHMLQYSWARIIVLFFCQYWACWYDVY